MPSGATSKKIKSRAVTSFIKQVSAALKRIGLKHGETILIGLSGGPDSVALLHALDALQASLQFNLTAAHLNHRLRGAEANRDEAFVRRLCADRGIDLTVERAGGLTPTTPNLEERARDRRHRFLHRVAKRSGAEHIALAHHADDQAETVLMRLLRGAGATGLSAMAEAGPAQLIRPLLRVDRSAIMDYLRLIGAEWVTDSSNHSPNFLRNRIRLELMPLIEREYAPGIGPRLTALAEEMRALDRHITTAAQQAIAARRDGDRLIVAGFKDLDPVLAHALIREYLRGRLGDLRHLTRKHIVAINELCAGSNPGGRVALPGGRSAHREYELLSIGRFAEKRPPAPFSIKLKRSGSTAIAAIGFRFDAKMFKRGAAQCPRMIDLEPMEALFDTTALGANFAVRNLRPGDRLEPQGTRGTRKVQDIFVDRKLPRALRARWPIVIAGETIIWIPGMARSRHALISQETAKIQHLRAFPPSASDGTSVA